MPADRARRTSRPTPPTPPPRGTPGPPEPPAGPSDPARSALVALVARLREAEARPAAEGLADALWLAAYVPGAAPGAVEGGTGPVPADPPRAGTPGPPRDPAAGTAGPVPSGQGRTGLYGPAQAEAAYGITADGRTRTRTVPVPVPAALPDAPALERALRPLQRYRPPVRAVRSELDEIATADRAADTGIVVPVLAAVRRREARIALVMDESSSNVVWSGALDELRRICERAGAFREVTVHRVGADDPLPAHLADPTGHRLTVVLSDCAGPLWRGGRMQRLLHTWAATAPVCVVQPLPQRMWGRTHLPARPGLLRRREGPAGRLEFVPRGTDTPAAGIPVPVLALRRSSFDAWARLVAGATGQSLDAAAATVTADHPPTAARPRAERRIDPARRVRDFRRTASPAAARLAVYLSAVPLVLPVMRLVQRAMLHRSGPDVLAEVLLSGLLRRDDRTTADATPPGAAPDPADGPGYAFLDGVREELLGRLGAGTAALVLEHCSEYVASRYGRSVRNFPATAAAFLSGAVDPAEARTAVPAPRSGPGSGSGSGDDERGLWAFAQVSAQVLRRLGGPSPTATPPGDRTGATEGPDGLAARARACLDHFREHGTVRELDTAIRLLGSATHAERRPARRAALSGELAEALLRRWYLRPVPEDLPEALEAAQNALTEALDGHLTLARVLEIMADEVVAGRLGAKLLPEWVAVRSAALAAEAPGGTGRPGHPSGPGGPLGPDGPGGWPEPALTATVLLTAADTGVAELTEGPARWDPALRDEATPLRARVLRRLAVTGAAYGPGGPAVWFTTTLGTAVTVVGAYCDETLTRLDTAAHPDSDLGRDPAAGAHRDAHLLRGGLLLELARHHRGRGPVPAAPPDPAASRAHAARAADGLLTGIDATGDSAAPADARALVRIWLEYADAVELTYEHLDDDARLRVLQALDQALDQARRIADRDETAEADILLRMAGLLDERYEAGGSWAHRDSVIAAWTEALPLLPRHDPGRAGVLTSLGRRLVERGVDKSEPADIRTAVRHLRAAVDRTPAGDPALPTRRALLGHAHLERFRADGTLADLHEADWALGEAARTGTDPGVVAGACWNRALAVAFLAHGSGFEARLGDAVAHRERAAGVSPELVRRLESAERARLRRLPPTAEAFSALRPLFP
ncbi:SAV_2336 N-terminal domain-related protein [Streptomyces sp. NPDC020875]|uniref:SAV_2336 N-terminal domain-related protein n=1 Tax=Streptomyces sp. NPDC020875 TaxID=3154898 RepID=UPI0033DA5519